MTDRELMQQALDVIIVAIKSGDWKVDGACDPDFVINALRARLAQPERKWVGLTDEEKKSIFDSCEREERGYVAAMVEAKLKEKNT